MSTYSYFNFCIFIFVGHEVPGVVAALFSKVAGSKYTCKRLRVYEATKSVWTALSQEVIFECWNALKRKRVSNVFVNSCNSALDGCHVIWIKAIYLSIYLGAQTHVESQDSSMEIWKITPRAISNIKRLFPQFIQKGSRFFVWVLVN